MTHSNRLALVSILIFALLPSALVVEAAPSAQARVTISARGGFGDNGTYIIGEWFPVKVSLTNPAGGSSRRVRVEVDSEGDSAGTVTASYVREVELPAPSHKEVTLYASARNFARSIDIRLMEGSTQIDRATARLEPLEQASNIIVAVVSQDPSALNVLANEHIGHVGNPLLPAYGGYIYPTPTPFAPVPSQPPMSSSPARASIARINLADLPSSAWALSGLGALVLDGAETGSLSVEQQRALADWVAGGGTLIAAAAPGAEGSLGGLTQAFPVEVSGTKSLSGLDRLAEWIGQPAPAQGSTLVPVGQVKAGATGVRVPVTQDGVPLVVVGDVGAGQMVYLGLSPSVAPLKNWDGTLPLFRRLLAEHSIRFSDNSAGSGYYGYYPNKVFQTYGNVFDLPGLDLPSPILIGLFLIIYIMVIGPTNFLILRRMRRTELAWITIPALVFLFSIAAYGIAYQSKGGDLVAIRANVTHTEEGTGRASATQYLGLFSPTRGSFRLHSPADAIVSEINAYGYGNSNSPNPLRISADNGTTVDNVKVNTWSLRGFTAESAVEVESPLEADLHLSDEQVTGTVRNRTAQGLQDVVLIRGDSVQHFNYIGPGEKVDVKLRISSNPFSYTSPVTLLPLPPGVQDPTNQNTYNYGGSNLSNAQRIYNRKVEVLNMTLRPLVDADPPSSLNVLTLAWGPAPPALFTVQGGLARYDDLNLWTSRLAVKAAGGDQPTLKSAPVPYVIYAPGSGNDWMQGPPAPSTEIALKPYADVRFSLPLGTVPQTLALTYATSLPAENVALMVFNVKSGRWDELAPPPSGSNTIMIPDPASHTGPAGDVNIRLLARGGETSLYLTSLGLALNSTP